MKKVLLMGGVGNRLFQVARAASLQHLGAEVEVIHIDKYSNLLNYFWKWTIHEDWVDIESLCKQLNITSRSASFWEILILVILKYKKKNGVNFDIPLGTATDLEFDVGYFQDKELTNTDGMSQVINGLLKILKLEQTGFAVCHLRGTDFNLEDRLQEDILSDIDTDLPLYVVTDDSALFDKQRRVERYAGVGPMEDFCFLASAKLLCIGKSSFAFWAACCALESHRASVRVINHTPWEELLDDIYN